MWFIRVKVLESPDPRAVCLSLASRHLQLSGRGYVEETRTLVLQGLNGEEASGGHAGDSGVHAESCSLLGFLEKQGGFPRPFRGSSVSVPLPSIL